MGYIGVQPEAGFTSGLLDRFTSTTGSTVTLTHDISSENDIIVFVNFVKQDSTNYSVGGSGNKTLTLGGTLVSSDIVEVHYLNIVKLTQQPSANSVGVTELNLSEGTSGQALTTNGSGTLSFSTISAGITEADQWRVTTNFTNSGSSAETITANWERADVSFEKIGTGLTQSSGLFSFPRTGKYLISALASYYPAGANSNIQFYSAITTDNGSNYSTLALALSGASGADRPENIGFNYICDVTETTNTKIHFGTVGATNITWQSNTNSQRVGFTCIRLGDT